MGHQALIRAAREIADQEHLKVFVHTYEVSPYEVITGKKVCLLTDNTEKERLLREYGADEVIYSRFDQEIMKMTGRFFFEEILLKTFSPRVIVAGQDHRFGNKGDTDTVKMRMLCDEHNIRLVLIPPVMDQQGTRISSSEIRNCLKNGDLAKAEQMLGHQYSKRGSMGV